MWLGRFGTEAQCMCEREENYGVSSEWLTL